MSKELDAILTMLKVDYAGCHNCKNYDKNIPFYERGNYCLKCVPTNWKGIAVSYQDKKLGKDWEGCHNCEHYNPDMNWNIRSNECKICAKTNWKPVEWVNPFTGEMRENEFKRIIESLVQ